jgi:hypothetical protein
MEREIDTHVSDLYEEMSALPDVPDEAELVTGVRDLMIGDSVVAVNNVSNEDSFQVGEFTVLDVSELVGHPAAWIDTPATHRLQNDVSGGIRAVSTGIVGVFRIVRGSDADHENTSRHAVQYELDTLLEHGLSPAEALDYWMTEIQGVTENRWGTRRGRTGQAINENVQTAREKLGDT